MKQLIGTYSCNNEDQKLFAELSGDFNPLHISQQKARRYLFGQSVMHGIHMLLRGLEFHLNNGSKNHTISFLEAQFTAPIYIEDSIDFYMVKGNKTKIEVIKGDSIVASFSFALNQPNEKIIAPSLKQDIKENIASELSSNEIQNMQGKLGLYLNKEKLSLLFPKLNTCFNHGQLAGLLTSTKLVGMICPGLNSIYSELKIKGTRNIESSFNYVVKKFKKRYGMATIDITSYALSGSIQAFHRPLPKSQESFKMVKSKVKAINFGITKALIIGGSRGVGEACAKVLAANNIEVIISYNSGKEETDIVVNEIKQGGGKASSIQLDITQRIDIPDLNIDGLFYFASPPIFVAKKGEFQISIFNHFNQFYINGFLKVFCSLDPDLLKLVFYPSTVAINEKPLFMAEYFSSKLAGEGVCSFLEQKHPDITFKTPRLPRLASDQTVSLLPVKNENAVDFFIDYLKASIDN